MLQSEYEYKDLEVLIDENMGFLRQAGIEPTFSNIAGLFMDKLPVMLCRGQRFIDRGNKLDLLDGNQYTTIKRFSFSNCSVFVLDKNELAVVENDLELVNDLKVGTAFNRIPKSTLLEHLGFDKLTELADLTPKDAQKFLGNHGVGAFSISREYCQQMGMQFDLKVDCWEATNFTLYLSNGEGFSVTRGHNFCGVLGVEALVIY